MTKLPVAYFTMEIGLESSMPTFAGGLGMLAADLLKSCADMGVGAACLTMCWKRGYPRQQLHDNGDQSFADGVWDPASRLTLLPQRVTVKVEGRDVQVGVRMLNIAGVASTVPVYFLDTDLPENAEQDREITNQLYGGDQRMRLMQETVLGIGGVRMLRALGYDDIDHFHLNEGHCAFLTLELLRERNFVDADVRRSCAFTTHTPIPAGHDVFPYDLAERVLGDQLPWHIRKLAGEDHLSTTTLAMTLSHYTCGVSQLHGEVSRGMLNNASIGAITNGVHAPTWASPELSALFDTYLPEWRANPSVLQNARAIPAEQLWQAHMAGKQRLCDEVQKRTGRTFDPNVLTLVEARRIVPYKQIDLLYADIKRLVAIGGGKLQIIHSGNTFPGDQFARDMVKKLTQVAKEMGEQVKLVFLPNYGPDLAKILVGGCDVWCNTPTRRLEASGTSGMKAALNGVLNCSILDGWWIEGFALKPESGWRIGPQLPVADEDSLRHVDAEEFYETLQTEILPQYGEPTHERWTQRMYDAIGLLATFNTNRCIEEYCRYAWGIPLSR